MAATERVSSQRLDSWKAIAEYLGRDVRTVHRWEKTLGLPVRRVSGERGRSVFAYTAEIDAWLQAHPPTSPEDIPSTDATIGTLAIDAAVRPRNRWSSWPLKSVAVLVAAVSGAAWLARGIGREHPLKTIRATPTEIVALDDRGVERWRHTVPAGEIFVLGDTFRDPLWLAPGGEGLAVIVGIPYRLRSDKTARTGELLGFSAAGRLEREFLLEDRFEFGADRFDSPWVLTDYRLDARASGRRIAISAHHFTWWPSLVTILNDRFERAGTFVNPGWIEQLHWMAENRIVVSGFSDPWNGGMIALLDARAMEGQAPAYGHPKFRCTSCDSHPPLKYIVFPRSELNRVTGSRFNRAAMEALDDRLIVRTIEVPYSESQAADALYELSSTLDLLRASYSDRYWEIHRALESQGKITHARDACPDRDGPKAIHVWEPRSGWQTVTIKR